MTSNSSFSSSPRPVLPGRLVQPERPWPAPLR
jgi:hypothetical protein